MTEITLYTAIELDQSLNEVVAAHNLSGEDILLMRLIKARDYYIDNLYQEGDYEISMATLSPKKTPLIDMLSKQIYEHRFDYRRMTDEQSHKRVRIRDLKKTKRKIYPPKPQTRISYHRADN